MSKKQHSPQSSPIDNLTYDVITIIHEKAKGLEAFDKYIEDAGSDEALTTLLENIREQDRTCIGDLEEHLARLLAESGYSGENEGDDDDMEDEEEGDEDRMEQVEKISAGQRKQSGKKK